MRIASRGVGVEMFWKIFKIAAGDPDCGIKFKWLKFWYVLDCGADNLGFSVELFFLHTQNMEK